MKDSKKYTFMKMAEVASIDSHSKRTKVGAVLAKGNTVVTTGYNGTPAGTDTNCEEACPLCDGKGEVLHIDEDAMMSERDMCYRCQGTGLITKDTVLHAELNVLLNSLKHGVSSDDCTMIITLSPCKQCSIMMQQAGIKEVYYKEKYRITTGIDYLHSQGIVCEQLTDEQPVLENNN